MTRTVKTLAALLSMLGLSACGHSASQREGAGSTPLRTYTASDDSLVLGCGGVSMPMMRSIGDPFATARVFPGGTWELTASKDPSPDTVRYYLQSRGETCQVVTESQWKKASNNH